MEDLEINIEIIGDNKYKLLTNVKVPKINWYFYIPVYHGEPTKVQLIGYKPICHNDNLDDNTIEMFALVKTLDGIKSIVPINWLFKSKTEASKYKRKEDIK